VISYSGRGLDRGERVGKNPKRCQSILEESMKALKESWILKNERERERERKMVDGGWK